MHEKLTNLRFVKIIIVTVIIKPVKYNWQQNYSSTLDKSRQKFIPNAVLRGNYLRNHDLQALYCV